MVIVYLKIVIDYYINVDLLYRDWRNFLYLFLGVFNFLKNMFILVI